MDYKYVVIFITTPTVGEGRRISKVLVEQKQAACVSIVPKVSSQFWWQGKPDSREESLLIVKTRVALLDKVIKLVKKIHSDDVPEIIALPIIGGNEDYLDWIDKTLK